MTALLACDRTTAPTISFFPPLSRLPPRRLAQGRPGAILIVSRHAHEEISLRERCSALRGSWSAPVRPRNCASFARSPLFCASVIFETTINCPRSCASLPWNTARCRQRECRPILLFHAPLVPALHFVIASHLLFLFHCDLLPGVILFLAFVVAWVACFLSCSCSAFALGPPLWLCCLVVRLLSNFFGVLGGARVYACLQ